MLRVACAIIVREGKVLVTRRGPGMKMPGKWEFPGGKVEPGETAKDCIIREIYEELHISIEPVRQLHDCIYDYGEFQIVLIPFVSGYLSGEIQLAEHSEFLWISPHELESLDWAPADRALIKGLIMSDFII